MSTEPQSATSPAAPPGPAPTGTSASAPDKGPLGKIVRFSLIALVLMFVYHLFADRITPYTSQATIDTFLVQIAPEVSGPVKAVGVIDNHPVKKGQVLFQIEPQQFKIAVQSAEASLALAMQNADSSEADIRVADAQLQRQRIQLATSRKLGAIIQDLAEKKALSETTAIRARSEIDVTEADITRAIATSAVSVGAACVARSTRGRGRGKRSATAVCRRGVSASWCRRPRRARGAAADRIRSAGGRRRGSPSIRRRARPRGARRDRRVRACRPSAARG